jgi:tetratricopeptide (TPR) repeat protein
MIANPSNRTDVNPLNRHIALWKRVAFSAFIVILFFAILEIILRGTGVETLIQREDPFRGFSRLVTVFEREGDMFRTHRATRGSTFNDQSFAAEKGPGGIRIFCLGGSSSYGYPWGAEAAFTSILGDALASRHPGREVEAINVSGVSYGMFRLNIVADELLQYEPDVLIVFSGHNEFIEPAFFAAEKRRGRAGTGLKYVLSNSRVYSGMHQALKRKDGKQASMRDPVDVDVRREDWRAFSADEKKAVVQEFRKLLERLVDRAQTRDVKVVLVTVPCNLREWQPEQSNLSSDLETPDRDNWSEAMSEGTQGLKQGDFAAAKINFELATRFAPEHAKSQFLLALACEGLGQWDQARRAYKRACDEDASPSRRLSSINDAIRAVARKQNALLVDADRIFEEQSEEGLVGFGLIEDYVHPTHSGHELIAWHIWDAIERVGWFADKAPADRKVFDRVVAERQRQPTAPYASWFFNQGVLLQEQGHWGRAIEKYGQALEIAPEYPVVMLNLSKLLIDTGETEEAVRVLRKLVEIDPQSAPAQNHLGVALCGLRRFEDSLPYYREALRLKPDYADAHNNFGAALQTLGRFEESLSHYEQALRFNPGLVQVRFNMGNILREQKRFEEAVAHYREFLRLVPNHAGVHHNLGLVLEALGRHDEAATHRDKARSRGSSE